MLIYARELKPGDMFLVDDSLRIAPRRENLKLDLYFIIDVKLREWRIEIKALRMDHRGSPAIMDISAGRSEIFSRHCIPLRFQEMDLVLSDAIPDYS